MQNYSVVQYGIVFLKKNVFFLIKLLGKYSTIIAFSGMMQQVQ